MTICQYPSQTAKYFVLVFDTDTLPPVLRKGNPIVCSFYGTGFFSTTRKEAYALALDLSKRHPNRLYMVQCLNCSTSTLRFPASASA